MTNKFLCVVALGLMPLLGGCVATLTGATSAASGITGQIDQAVDSVILQKLQDAHNLGVAIQQINAAPGMVQVTMPPPAVTTTMAPVTTTTPPTGTLPTAPTSNG